MKRELYQVHDNLRAAVMRLEDLARVHPDAAASLNAIVERELRPAQERVEYLQQVAP